MAYLPTAVDIGYLRHDFEIPLPGPDFARRVSALLRDNHQTGLDVAELPDRHTFAACRPQLFGRGAVQSLPGSYDSGT